MASSSGTLVKRANLHLEPAAAGHCQFGTGDDLTEGCSPAVEVGQAGSDQGVGVEVALHHIHSVMLFASGSRSRVLVNSKSLSGSGRHVRPWPAPPPCGTLIARSWGCILASWLLGSDDCRTRHQRKKAAHCPQPYNQATTPPDVTHRAARHKEQNIL